MKDIEIRKGEQYYYDMFNDIYGYVVIKIEKCGEYKSEAKVIENHVKNNDFLWEYFENFKNHHVHFYAQNKRIRRIIPL